MKPLIIAGGALSQTLIPFDSDVEIWGINDNAMKLKRFDVLFDIHSLDWIKSKERDEGYYDWLCKLDKPVIMQKHFEDIPTSEEFPYKDYVNKYGEIFFSSFDWMMAYAIEKGYKDIQLYGIDMAVQEEFLYQRPSAMYWIGLARGLGVKIAIQEDSALNTKSLYGFSDSSPQIIAQTLVKIYDLKAKLKTLYTDHAFNEGMVVAINNLITIEGLDLQGALSTGISYAQGTKKLIESMEAELDNYLEDLSETMKCKVVLPENEVIIKG